LAPEEEVSKVCPTLNDHHQQQQENNKGVADDDLPTFLQNALTLLKSTHIYEDIMITKLENL
jgi:hypothetical protein